MVVLLTGATGFLGKYLLDDLSNMDVRVVTRSPEKITNGAIDVVKADITEKLPNEIFKDVTTLIHSAAKVDNWPKDKMKGYFQTNVLATRQIITDGIKNDIPRIIYTSSYFALGATNDMIVDETWNNPPTNNHPYVRTKYEAGTIVDQIAKDYPILQLLPTVILGPGVDNPISHAIIDFINGKLVGLPGGGQNSLNFVSADDVARAHLIGIDSKFIGKYLIGGENMRLIDLFKKIGDKLDITHPRAVPFKLSKLYARMLEVTGNPKLTTNDIEIAKLNYQYDCSKSDVFGIDRKPIDVILDELLVDFLNRGVLNKKGEHRVLQKFRS